MRSFQVILKLVVAGLRLAKYQTRQTALVFICIRDPKILLVLCYLFRAAMEIQRGLLKVSACVAVIPIFEGLPCIVSGVEILEDF